MSQEVDLAALRRLLADVSRKAEQAQAKVIATIETKHVEFVAASDQVGDLRGGVERLQGDLRRSAALLAEGESAAGGQDSPPVLRLRTAITEYTALKGELDALDATTLVLNRMLEVQRQFTELDQLISSAEYPESAEKTLEIAKVLQSVSAPDASAEPGMVRAAKAHYYQRRAALVQRLEEALGRRASFGERHALARPGEEPPGAAGVAAGGTAEALPRLWGALDLLGLRERRAERLAEEARRAVLWPLLEAARRLPRGQKLEAKISTEASGTVAWTWVIGKDTSSDVENRIPQANSLAEPLARDKNAKQRPCVRVVLPVLESFFAFAREHFAGNSGGVYEVLGKRLWPPLASFLMRHFDICESDGGAAAERFELSMQSQGLIGSKERTLVRHVHDHRRAFGEQRRASMLAEVRGWLLQDDASLVQVSDAEEPGSVSQILEQMDARPPGGDAADSDLALAPQDAGGFFSEKLRSALRDDAGFLRVPTMRVSASVHKLARRVRELTDEMAAAIAEGRVDGARDLNRLIREVCALFSVLRPHVQKGQLKSSPQCCAVFFTDCLYLVHVLLLVPYTHGRSLPAEHRQLALFVDLVPQIRRLGEHHFLSMLRHQQEQLIAVLRPCDFGAGIAQDRRYIAAEAALGAAVQQAKAAAQGLAGVLPAQLFREVAGLLLGVLCQDLFGKLLRLQRIEPGEVGCLSGLLTSALVGSRQILSVLQSCGGEGLGSGGEAGIAEDIPGWGALTLAADLLGSGFSRFLEQRTQLLKVLKKDDILKLMQLSWQDEFLSPDEAWTALSSSE